MRKIITLLIIYMSISIVPFAESTTTPEVRTDMLVTTEWLSKNLDNPDVVILHATWTPKNYDSGHIPGAQLLGWNDIAVTRDGIPNEVPSIEKLVAMLRRVGIDENDRIVLYEEGAGLVATRAYAVFDYLGLGEQTAMLDGQLKKWQAEGRPTTTNSPSVTPSSYEPQIRPEVIMPLEPLRELVKAQKAMSNPSMLVLDARPKDDYTGKNTDNEKVKRPGHIPGAANVYWMQTVESKENPVLRPAEEIRTLYTKAGLTPEDTVVTYCQSGVQAAHAYFTLKYLGYKPRLYDGSFIEWSAMEDLPINTGLEP